MPTQRLTDKSVVSLPLNSKGYRETYDTRLVGFGVRSGPKSKSYFVTGRIKNQSNSSGAPLKFKINLGKVGILPFDVAYDLALKILADAAQGISPKDRKTEQVVQSQLNRVRDITLRQIFTEYCTVKKKLKTSTKESYLETLTCYVSDWLDLPIREITPDMVVHRHSVTGKKSPAMADYTFRIIRALCNHTIETYEDIMQVNPVRRLSRLGAWYKVPRKRSYLAPSSLRVWVPAMMQRDIDARDYFLGLLFTGARYDEFISLKWKDVDLTDGVATFRETKTGVPLTVPICGYYLRILRDRRVMIPAEAMVFPSVRNDTGHLVNLRNHLRAVEAETGVRVSHHDLRRSFLSYADEVGVSPYAQKRLCNHALPQDVTEGYLQFSIERLRRDVEAVADFILLHTWGDFIPLPVPVAG